MKIGVIAAQGAFIEHVAALKKLDVNAVEVRLPDDLKGLDGLIIPGGESTSISRIMTDFKLMDAVKKLAKQGLPIFGTCAGLIMLARKVPGSGVEPLDLMDIKVKRNAFGRQVGSFETAIEIPALGKPQFPAVFIRAPLIEDVDEAVEILARLDGDCKGEIVAARQGNLLVTAFHPELTDDLRLHEYFLKMVKERRKSPPKDKSPAKSNH
jgi:pyridoxal 5'-phosphate synthase pdxT subunit